MDEDLGAPYPYPIITLHCCKVACSMTLWAFSMQPSWVPRPAVTQQALLKCVAWVLATSCRAAPNAQACH